ncbi:MULTISPECIES: M60 family metallopeptidase [unclassified Sphingobacterium]|uniref:M60 family metallopeptidase n=1 Tax=unclassified Sphingobacterium TaxID=2609468 RepID=UPI00143B909B|nr:M60 family metallopeptidase [Sphingobacterium sp. B16(2022)]NJI74637.1 PRTRC system protein C [Sphingobacterium sp. B16(2022)]
MNKLFTFLLITVITVQSYAQQQYSQVFAKDDYSQLKKNARDQDIENINNLILKQAARQLKEGSYPIQKRLRAYTNYQSPNSLSNRLKTSPYSQYENPTGIYFTAGDEAIVWVGKTNGSTIALRVTNWDDKNFKQKDYNLKEGYNALKIENKGNAYIQYFTEDKVSSKKINIHILGGKVNDVFERGKHTNKDWDRMLGNASGPILDIVGKQVQLAYSVKSLQENAPHQGVELIQLYDSIIGIQHQIMGLTQTKRVPKNRMFGRVIWQGFMHADGIGAAFHDNTMKDVANVANLRKNSWGVAHEFGHVNQVRPNMKWVGTTEVTNNIYSVWTQYTYNSHSPKLERERLKDYDEPKIGGRITAYMESAFVHRQPWLTQAGPDRWDRQRPRDWGGDHFVKLVPLWQLQLYFNVAGKGNSWENKNFYGDIFTKAINAPATATKQDAYYQLEFIKNACDASKLDLTDFFEQSGMLIPIDLWVDDYTCAQMTITAADIAAVKQYASKYKKPSTPVLHYITANSTSIYKNRLPLNGIEGSGFEKKEDKIIVQNSAWKNAVAFETYAGDKLVKIAFVGAGSNDVSSTTVHTPKGTTQVKAVGWDGKRINVL